MLIGAFLHVQMCGSATFLYQRQDRINHWSRHTGKPSNLLDGGDQCIDLHSESSAGALVIRSSVAPVSALMGLKQTLPHSFNQMFQRILSRTGASMPDSLSALLSAITRV